MKVRFNMEIDVVERYFTVGGRKFVVALETGGTMEDPNIKYRDYQIINADSPEKAVEKYNDLNDCSYFYGHIMKEL